MTSKLFAPVAIGSVTLPNRIVVAPMCQYSAADGSATDWHQQHLSQLGYSGAGLVVVEATAVERRGRITHGCLGLYTDENEAALARVIAAARRFAGPTRFGIQLAHAGRKASCRRPWEGGSPLPADEYPWQSVSSSDLPFGPSWPAPAALREDQLHQITAAFADAATRAARIGFDVVELHCAHGYLVHEFLSPIANRRDDAYGGSLGNRMRLPLAIIRAVREALPASLPLGMRVSATDWVDGGWDVAQTIEFVRAAMSLGVEFVCASSGGIMAGVSVPLAPGYQVKFAEQIRRETGILTRAVGLITTPGQAEHIIASGEADMVAVARAMLDNPRWGWHAADALGAKAHAPDPYHMARGEVWKKFRDQEPATV